MRELIYLPEWYLKNMAGKKHQPLQTVLFLTDYCNLHCRHCAEGGHAGTVMKPWRQIEEELRYSYRKGSRFLDLEGGEPTLWRDGSLRINDVIRLAKEIGFFSVTVTTNGQQPFGHLQADSVWVSLDGYRGVHDQVRGAGTFARLHKNVLESGHPAVSFSMSVNRLNWKSAADVLRYTKSNPAVRSLAVNFHTPYPGTEDLMLPDEIRNRVIDLLLAMKKKGSPVMNSVSGLRRMRRTEDSQVDLSQNCWITNFILADGTRLSECPGKTLGVCGDCGFSMAGEMYSVVHLQPDTLLAGLSLRLPAGRK